VGNLYLDQFVPGAFDVMCLLCGRSAGVIYSDELVSKGASHDAVRRAENSVSATAFLWERAS
jgi:hypothetical protein